ncbi:hypothetical protein MasN3_37020 [Massilia varians]|uniref:Uncharacterized protein n=1 Tax=Massilia varians TaxID=457921 RepID=A0ABM8CAA5_9BURK|nr:hypothetical protein MasN3_37020 [Massilia varians]
MLPNTKPASYQKSGSWPADANTCAKVVDTAESSVRIFLSHARKALLGATVVVHAWVEPYCAAADVVATTLDAPWPSSDPAGARVNAVDFSGAQVRVHLPACSDGFHPYGSADIVQAADFTAERVVSILDQWSHRIYSVELCS